MFYSDDPLMDFDRYDREQAKQREIYPVCAYCDHEIQDERLLHINGQLFHIDCAIEAFGEWTEDYTE